MSTLRKVDPIQEAIREFSMLIRERFPEAEFATVKGFDPPGTLLEVRVATDDFERTFEEIFDAVEERLVDYQIKGPLPVTILPIRPREAVT